MEKYADLLAIWLPLGLLLMTLVVPVVKMCLEAIKKRKAMGRLKAGSVWRFRPKRLPNDPFDEYVQHLVTVKETRVNSDGRMGICW